MRVAYESTRDELRGGSSLEQASRLVKQRASFAGMRNRLCGWLDELEVPSTLGITTSDALFDAAGHLVHTTSAVRYPAMIDGNNYSGSRPQLLEQPELRRYLVQVLAPELDRVPGALVVPLGKSVSRAVAYLTDQRLLDPHRCLAGFPHPSGANGGGPAPVSGTTGRPAQPGAHLGR